MLINTITSYNGAVQLKTLQINNCTSNKHLKRWFIDSCSLKWNLKLNKNYLQCVSESLEKDMSNVNEPESVGLL